MLTAFRYSAVNRAGAVVRGALDADSRQDLERRLHRLGLDMINCGEVKNRWLADLFAKKISRDELAQFCFYVERLLAGGVPLLEGLADVRDSVANATLRNVIAALISDVEQGATLSSAMRRHPKIFDSVFVSLVEAGEHSGELHSVLKNLGDNIKWHDEMVRKTKKVMRYPLFAFAVMIAATYMLMAHVVPPMTRILESLGQELPPHTVALIRVSDFTQAYLGWIVAAAGALWAGALLLVKTAPSVAYALDRFKIRVPIFGPVMEKVLLSRFSNVFAMLYRSGVSVIEGLKISRGALGNRFVARGLDNIIARITTGASLSLAFQESGLFPPLVLRMIRLGENTGGVDSAMMQVKRYYDRDANEAIEAAQGAVAPAMMALLAALLLWVIAAVYGPLYDLVGTAAL